MGYDSECQCLSLLSPAPVLWLQWCGPMHAVLEQCYATGVKFTNARIIFQNNITCFSTLPCLKFLFARSIYYREKLMAGRSRALAQKVECIAAMFLLTNTNTAEHCVDILLSHL